jgi:hypothetical protein
VATWDDVSCDPNRTFKIGGTLRVSDANTSSQRRQKLPANPQETWQVGWTNLTLAEKNTLVAAYNNGLGVRTWTSFQDDDEHPRNWTSANFKVTRVANTLWNVAVELTVVPGYFTL